MIPRVDRSAIVASWARIVFDAPHVGPRDVFYTRAVPGMEAGWYVRASVLAPAIPVRIGPTIRAIERRAQRKVREGTAAPDLNAGPYVESDAEFLVRLAQNDYMIDSHYLPDGLRLLALAERLKDSK